MRNKLSLLILLTILSAPSWVNAQNANAKSKPQTAKNAAQCKSNKIAFSCPENFQIKNNGKLDNVYAAYNSEQETGLFVFSSVSELSEQNIIEETLKSALQSLYSTDYKDYQWKDSDDYNEDDSWSKHEVSKFAKVGFNKKYNHTVHIQLVRLFIEKKDILAGFVYELEKGSDSERQFKKWLGGGNGNASDSLQELVINITGEKKDKYSTPGGPPPPAE